MSEVKKQRNVAIEFWRVFVAIAIVGFHTGWIIARSANGSNGYWMQTSNWFFGSSETLLIFTLTAGYFMIAHFDKRAKDPEYLKRSATSRAWEYTWTRVKALLPVLILGYILGVLISTPYFYPEYGFREICTMLVNSAWEFLGFHAAGLRSAHGEFFNLNGVLWFISAMLILGYFLYWGLCWSRDTLAGLISPFVFIFFAGWWSFTGTRAAQTAWSTFGTQLASSNGMGGSATDATATLGFNNGLIFVMLGMMGGMILYQLMQAAKKHEPSSAMKGCLTVLNVISTALLAWYIIFQPTYFGLERWTVALLQMVVIFLNLYNVDGLTRLLNNSATSGLLQYLGGISLYIYMLHYPVAIGILRFFGKNSEATAYGFWQIYLPTIIITLVASCVVKKFMDMTVLKKKEATVKN